MNETIDSNLSSSGLSTSCKPSYIQVPFNIWKFSLIGWVLLGFIGGFSLIYMEFIAFPDYASPDAVWDEYYANYQTAIFISIICFVLAYFGLILYIVFGFILLYRNWRVIENASDLATTSPGQAVGMLFVPFYNIYWQFMAFWKLSEGQQKFIEQSGINVEVKPKPSLALAFCICNCVPWLGQFASFFILGPMREVNQKKVSMEIIRQAGS